MATRRLTDSSEGPVPSWVQAQPTPPRRHEGLQVDYTFLRRYRVRQVDHTSFLFGSKRLADQPFNDDQVENQEYKYYSKLGLPYISIFTVFKVIAAAVTLAVVLFGLIKALIKAIKELLKTMKKVIKVAGSLKMPDLSGEFLPDIPGLPKIPKLKLPSVPGLPSPPKLSLGKMFSLSGLSFSPIMAPLAILAAIALLTKYRIFKARLWPPLSGLPGLRNGLYRLPYRSFKGVFSHLPYFDQLYNAGGRFMGIAGLPTVAQNPGDQPMSASVPRPKIQGFLGDPYYNLVLSDWQYTHGVILGKSVLIPSIILNLSMRFKQFKEMVPLMGPTSVKEMFGMESFIQKIMRLLAKGAVAAGAASVVFLETEAVCPWPQDLQESQLEGGSSDTSFASVQGPSEFFRQSFHSERLHPEEAQCPLWLFPAVPQGSQLTLSLNNWLELPGCDFQDWLRAHRSSTVRKPCNLVTNGVKSDGYSYDRATTSHIAEYYKDYVNYTNIVSNFWNDAKVLSVKRVIPGDCTNCHCRMSSIPREGCWEIQGVKGTFPNMPELFVVHAYNVVLATGSNVPKLLGIPGENLPFVCHKMDQIDSYLGELSEVAHSMDPCLVVGAGLSAADCVLALRNKGVPVVHVVRRNGNDPKIIYNQLPGVVYPEYYKVGQMIKGEVTTAYGKDSSYVAYTKTTLVEIRKDKECILKKADGTLFKQKVSNVFVLVGAVPDLSFLPDINKNELGSNPAKKIDSKENPINVNPFTYETVLEPGLFAVGPLIGDNFVRFGIGGALGIANHLMREEE